MREAFDLGSGIKSKKHFFIVGAILLLVVGVIASAYLTDSGLGDNGVIDEPLVITTTKPITPPAISPPKLACFDDRKCLIDKSEELLEAQASLELNNGRFRHSSYYGDSYVYSASLAFEHTANDVHIRRVLSTLDNETDPQLPSKERIQEQLKLAAILDDKPLIKRYLQQAKQLLQEQSEQLRGEDLGIKPEWMFDAAGVPDEDWLALTRGEYKVTKLVAAYVRAGSEISPKTGLERLRQYKPYLDDYRYQINTILEAVVAEQLWSTWQSMLENNPKYFRLILERVQGNDKVSPVLPPAFVPWEILQERILAATKSREAIDEIYAYMRFAARDLSPKAFSDFFNTITVFSEEEKEDYAAYFVQQLIRHKRYDDAREAISLFTFADDQQKRLVKRLAEAVNPPRAFEDNFTFADYQNYVQESPVHGPCRYLQDLKEDSSSYLMSSSHAYLAKKRIRERGAILKLFGKDIETSCQLIKKPCDAVYYLHKLSSYSEQRPSITKAMIQHINALEDVHPNTWSCNIYFLAGQLPFVNETRDTALFEDILSTIENKLVHPMRMSGYRGLSDDYQLYARGIADSLFMALQQEDETITQRLLALVREDKLQTYFLEGDLLYRLSKAKDTAGFERVFKGVRFLINTFHLKEEERERYTNELITRLTYDAKMEKFADKLLTLLTSFNDVLTDQNRHDILSVLLSHQDGDDTKEYPRKWWDLLTQQVLQLKFNSIQTQIKKHEKAEEYEHIEKKYGALQQALAKQAKPESTDAMLTVLKHYRTGLHVGVLADDLLIKLLKKAMLNKNISVVKRIAPVFQTSPGVLNSQINSGIRSALISNTATPDPLYALALYQLLPDSLGYSSDPQKGSAPLEALTTEGMTLSAILARKQPNRDINLLFCQLVQQKFVYEAEQLLLASASLYNAVNHQNQQLCSLELAIQLRSQPMIDKLFTKLRPSILVRALLERSVLLQEL